MLSSDEQSDDQSDDLLRDILYDHLCINCVFIVCSAITNLDQFTFIENDFL